MTSISRHLFRAIQRHSMLKSEGILATTSVGNIITQRKYAKKIPEYFQRFKVEPRQPITDLVTHELIYKDQDPAPLFMNSRVQDILKELTGNDPDRIYRHRKYKSIDAPKYEFLTDSQLKMAYEQAEKAATQVLLMPPIVKIKVDPEEIVQNDPALQGLFTDKLVITDISADVPDSKRIILVREADGTLKHASMEQRHRMNCIYNPKQGRTLHMPSLFSMKNLKKVIGEKEYEFVLDRACLQMEPYEATFQSVQAVTFEAIDTHGDYEMLISTRHYGPMVFFLSWNKKLDGLLESMLKLERLDQIGKVLELYSIMHPESKIASSTETDPEELLKVYLKEESKKSSTLELALQTYKDIVRTKEMYKDNVHMSHGAPSS